MGSVGCGKRKEQIEQLAHVSHPEGMLWLADLEQGNLKSKGKEGYY